MSLKGEGGGRQGMAEAWQAWQALVASCGNTSNIFGRQQHGMHGETCGLSQAGDRQCAHEAGS